MNKRLWIVGGVALASAVATTAFFYGLLADRLVDEAPAAERPIVVAARDLPRGTQLRAADLELTARDAANLPTGFRGEIEPLVGALLTTSLPAGAPVLSSHLPAAGGGGLSAAIPPGMRAVTLHVEEYAGVTEIVETGDRVDVLAGRSRRDGSIDLGTLLENIEVLATGRDGEPRGQKTSPTVTVLVAAEKSETLNDADQNGVIRLALRNPLEGVHALSESEDAERAAVEPRER